MVAKNTASTVSFSSVDLQNALSAFAAAQGLVPQPGAVLTVTINSTTWTAGNGADNPVTLDWTGP